MPLKEFECQSCRHKFEVVVWLKEPNPDACPKCGKKELKQLLSTFKIAGVRSKSQDADGEFGGDDAGMGEDFGGGGAEDFGDAGGEDPGGGTEDLGDDAGGGDDAALGED